MIRTNLGLAEEITDRMVDLPLRKPTKLHQLKPLIPVQSYVLDLVHHFQQFPALDFLAIAKRIFPRPPRPPLATRSSDHFQLNLQLIHLSSASRTVVPGGTFT